jgi:hypothetical protein
LTSLGSGTTLEGVHDFLLKHRPQQERLCRRTVRKGFAFPDFPLFFLRPRLMNGGAASS